MKFSKPKDCWKHFRKKKVSHEHSISLDKFFRYFSTLENNIFWTVNNETEDFCKTHNFDSFDFDNELDFPITHPLTSAEVCEKSSRWLWKKSCVSTGVRKPGNTYASPTASLAVKSCVKPQYNQLQPTNYTQSTFRYGEFKD